MPVKKTPPKKKTPTNKVLPKTADSAAIRKEIFTELNKMDDDDLVVSLQDWGYPFLASKLEAVASSKHEATFRDFMKDVYTVAKKHNITNSMIEAWEDNDLYMYDSFEAHLRG